MRIHRMFSWEIVLPVNKLPFGWHHLASPYFSRNSFGATVSNNKTKQTGEHAVFQSHVIPPLSKIFLFRSPHLVPNVPRSTGSPTWNSTGIIVHTASMILVSNAQLVWHERRSIMQSLSCNSCTFGRRLIELVVRLVLCRMASSACMMPIGHHRHWLAERHMLSATTRPAARYSGLKGCQVLHKCYSLLPACTKN